MLKRFTKSGKKQNKSGVILITILFILAVAFILIGSALMMTANTRKRLYSFAESSQARLTVTSAAQMLENALQSQELSDAKFKQLCDAGTTVWFTDKNLASPIPGMGGTGGPTGTAPDNCTSATFGWNGTKPTVKITTIIDDEVENVLLTYVGTPSTTVTSPFAYQVELGEGGRLDKIDIGNSFSGGRYNAEDNLVVSRGDGSSPYDSCTFYSTFITTKPMRSASGTHYWGDVVYAGHDSGVSLTGGGTGSGAMMDGGGTAYFINCQQVFWGTFTAAQTHESFSAMSTGAQVIFCNVGGAGGSNEQVFNGFQDGHVYELTRTPEGTETAVSLGLNSSNANVFNSGVGYASSAVTGKDLAYYIGNLDEYLDPNYHAPGEDPRPSSFDEFVDQFPVVNASGTAPAGTSNLVAGITEMNTGSVYTVPNGDVTGKYNIDVSNHDVVVYVGTIKLAKGAQFIVHGGTGTNDSNSYRCFFVIAPGGRIELAGDSSATVVNETDATGFFSTNVHAGNAITGARLQTQAPSIYIIGAGIGTSTSLRVVGDQTVPHDGQGQIACTTNQGNYIEAMVALYPSLDGVNDAGDFYTMQGPSCTFYGRIICNRLYNNNGDHFVVPYCPQFSSGEDPDALYRVYSAYTLESFDYYYEDTDPSATSSGLHH